LCVYTQRDEDVILFHHEGGIDIGDVDSKVSVYLIKLFGVILITIVLDSNLLECQKDINFGSKFISLLY